MPAAGPVQQPDQRVGDWAPEHRHPPSEGGAAVAIIMTIIIIFCKCIVEFVFFLSQAKSLCLTRKKNCDDMIFIFIIFILLPSAFL